jgi:2-iminobutanoate/2-iminopropanoate deaminase
MSSADAWSDATHLAVGLTNPRTHERGKSMPWESITSPNAPGADRGASPGVKAGRILAVSGQAGVHPQTGAMPETIEEQATLAISNIAAIVEAAGGTLADVIETTCFLQRLDDPHAFSDRIQRFLGAYTACFSPPYPARTTIGVQCDDVDPDTRESLNCLLEIRALAVIPE